jgi:redox-sensitive bicupin YhaK (pirin superfamily)
VSNDIIVETTPLGFPWITQDPFLFCVHHDDAYPAGTDELGPPREMLRGRNIGQDFQVKDGWRMYHGDVVPGFPQHPHRGFETVTILRSGYIDHSDSLGATARFGPGDVQWLTAGAGIVHCEMFPLLEKDKPNPLELFQIWLNLPRQDKLVAPHFSMLWSPSIPRVTFTDEAGRTTEVTVIAGSLGNERAPAPPPHSWATRPNASVAIWSIKLSANAKWTLPGTNDARITRSLYFFRGDALTVAGERFGEHAGIVVRSDREVLLEAGNQPVDILLLQGRPIDEPIAQYGPFVMNTRAEIQQAMLDYQRTQFGGWPWPSDGPVHPRNAGRFAKHVDGRIERLDP